MNLDVQISKNKKTEFKNIQFEEEKSCEFGAVINQACCEYKHIGTYVGM